MAAFGRSGWPQFVILDRFLFRHQEPRRSWPRRGGEQLVLRDGLTAHRGADDRPGADRRPDIRRREPKAPVARMLTTGTESPRRPLSGPPAMTLRLRLVLGLVALVMVGLAVFGVTTYVALRPLGVPAAGRALSGVVPIVTDQLYENAAATNPEDAASPAASGAASARAARGGRPILVPSGTYAELRDAVGRRRAQRCHPVRGPRASRTSPITSTCPPGSNFFTTGSEQGSGRWRVSASAARARGDGDVVVAASRPTRSRARSTGWCSSSRRGLGAARPCWPRARGCILRRGLRPLEQMATSARSITAGDLSQRVEPADDRTEVGQLGLALNTMLERDRGGVPRAGGDRAAAAPVPVRRLPRAAHAAHLHPGLRRAVPPRRRRSDRVDLAVILRRIEEETARMKVLVEDLLLLARLDETRPAERGPVDLAVLAADACSDAVAADPDRPVTLDAPEPVVVSGDRDHLRQAIANLVTNAVRHTPGRHPVEVAARVDGGAAVRRCATTGPASTTRRWPTCSTASGRPTAPASAPAPGSACRSWPPSPHEHGGTADGGQRPRRRRRVHPPAADRRQQASLRAARYDVGEVRS